MPLTLLITMMVCFAFSISIAVAIGGSAVFIPEEDRGIRNAGEGRWTCRWSRPRR